mgnify:CR=1 FL=1
MPSPPGTLERYELTWPGKAGARDLALAPAVGSLRPDKQRSISWDSTHNTFIEGDNLAVLKLLKPSLGGAVKMIYIDPPYNTGKAFIYPDRYPNWLNLMYPRLMAGRELLADDGVIFVSIDDHEVHNLRCLLDELFGPENFLAHIIWQHSLQPKGYSGIYSVHHNHLLSYRKTGAHQVHSLERTTTDNKAYGNPDDDPRGDWRLGDVRNALLRPNLRFEITTPSGKTIQPPANGWRWSQETLQKKISTGEIYFAADETRIIRKIYLSNQKGRTPQTLWFGKDVGTTRDGARELKALFDGEVPFDTVKPLGLVERMLRVAGVGQDDLVLDFFAGSCTTAHGVMRAGVGRYIAVQLAEPVNAATPHGKAALGLGLGDIAAVGLERIRRASQALAQDSEAKGTAPLDLGVKVYSLAQPD